MKKWFCTLLLAISFFMIYTVYADDVDLNCKVAISMDAESGIVLYGKDINKKIYPASTTKILTAILALENLNMEDTVVASKTAVAIPWDSSSIYIKKGEVFTIEELLYGMLLDSGNDAANVLAEAVSGDLSSFAELMNKKAAEIGCTNTHFANAHGYSDKNHYTTALDMAKIFHYCLQNEEFVKIISTKLYIIPETNKTNEKRYLYNTNRLLQTKEESVYGRYYKYCIGGKTGYTDEAGRCLISFGKKDDKTIITGIFDSHVDGVTDSRYTNAINLYEYSFNNFNKYTIAQANQFNYSYINYEKELNYSLCLKDNLEVLAKSKEDIVSLTYTITIDDNVLSNYTTENYNTSEAVGYMTFDVVTYDNSHYSFDKPVYLTNVEEYHIISKQDITVYILIGASLLILFCLVLLRINKKDKKKTKNNTQMIARKARQIKRK